MNLPMSTVTKITGGTPYHASAFYNKIECLKYLLSKNIQYLYQKNNNGYTILHSCAINNSLECFKYLVEEIKFDPMTPGPEGRNALEVAIVDGAEDVVNYILEKHLINPYLVLHCQMIFDYNNIDNVQQFYNNYHKNLVIIKPGNKIKLDDNMNFQFTDNYNICIHNNIKFANNNSIIKSCESGAQITSNYFRLRKNTTIIMNDYIETKIQKNISVLISNGMKVTLPKGRNIYINNILVTLVDDLDVEVII
jgi:ankyrin repeat protein